MSRAPRRSAGTYSRSAATNVRPFGARPYVYGGCIGPVAVGADLARRVHDAVQRLVAEFGGHRNIQQIITAIENALEKHTGQVPPRRTYFHPSPNTPHFWRLRD